MSFRIFISHIASIIYFVSIVSFAFFSLCSSSFVVDLSTVQLTVLFSYRSYSISLNVIMRCLFEVYHFIEQEDVQLIAVEAAGEGINSGKTAATTQLGTMGILHGSKSLLMQTNDGQVIEPHSISAGLDYPGIGPLHAYLYQTGRAKFMSATDAEAVEAAIHLSKTEGIIPALETAHALHILHKLTLSEKDKVVICLSGRGDKDLATYMNYL